MTRPNRIRPPKLPTLDPTIIGDEQLLGHAVDAVTLAEPELRKMSRRIVRLQTRLRGLVTDEAWAAYLDLEQVTSARLNLALLTVARWAFRQGRRSRGTRR